MSLWFMVAVLGLMATSMECGAAGRKGSIGAGVGGGIYITPLKADLQAHADYFITDHVSVGLNAEFILGGANFSIVPFGRYHFHINSLPRFSPYVGGGVGFASYAQEDSFFGFFTERQSFMDLMIPDVGFEYEVIPQRLFLGSDVSFHLVTDFHDHGRELRLLPAVVTVRF